jgi:hypothetical protein
VLLFLLSCMCVVHAYVRACVLVCVHQFSGTLSTCFKNPAITLDVSCTSGRLGAPLCADECSACCKAALAVDMLY